MKMIAGFNEMKLRDQLTLITGVLAWIVWINFFVMFFLYGQFGGSALFGGEVNSSGEYSLFSHGRHTVVSQSFYLGLLYYEIISWCSPWPLGLICVILNKNSFLYKKKSDIQLQSKGPVLSKRLMKFIIPILIIAFLYLFIVLIQFMMLEFS